MIEKFKDFFINESKKSDTVKLEKEATDYIQNMIEKKSMSRYEIVTAIRNKFNDNKLAQTIANNIIADKKINTTSKDKTTYYSYSDENDKIEKNDKKDASKNKDEKVLKFGSPEWREKYSKKK